MMREMLELPLELIFLKTCSVAKLTAEKRCSLSSPRAFLPLPHPSSHQESLKSPRARRATCARAEAPAGGGSCAPLPAICLRLPSARPPARHCRSVRGQEPRRTTFTWCHAQPGGWLHCGPTTPNPLTYSSSIIRLGFFGVLPIPIALVIESRWFLQFFWSWAFPKKHSLCSALSHHPLVYKGGTRSAILQQDKAFFSSKHQLQQLTPCSWGVEVTGKSPS